MSEPRRQRGERTRGTSKHTCWGGGHLLLRKEQGLPDTGPLPWGTQRCPPSSPPFSQPFHTLFPSGHSRTALTDLRNPGHISRAFKTLHGLELAPSEAIKCAQTERRRVPSPWILCKRLLREAGGATAYRLCYDVGAPRVHAGTGGAPRWKARSAAAHRGNAGGPVASLTESCVVPDGGEAAVRPFPAIRVVPSP